MDEDAYMGEVRLFAGYYAPRNWAFCEGQLLPISQYQALYSLLGTSYGGDGVQTFALPDLRGRVAIGTGDGPGQTPRDLGGRGGLEGVTLSTTQLPAHSHSVTDHAEVDFQVSTDAGTEHYASDGSYLAEGFFQRQQQHNVENYIPTSQVGMTVSLGGVQAQHTVQVAVTGSSTQHSNMQPWTAVRYIINLIGLYPPRN